MPACIRVLQGTPNPRPFPRADPPLAALRNKRLENPWKKHDNIPL